MGESLPKWNWANSLRSNFIPSSCPEKEKRRKKENNKKF
jgi:hypothetical protein